MVAVSAHPAYRRQDCGRNLFGRWNPDGPEEFNRALDDYLANVAVGRSNVAGEGAVQCLWSRVTEPWVCFDREAVLAYPSPGPQPDPEDSGQMDQARKELRSLAAREGWEEVKEVGNKLDRLAVDPEGRLAITDVTVDGPLPDELRGILAVAGCVGDALSLDGYRQTVEAAGFTVDHAQDLPEVASTFLRDIGGKLMIAKIAVGLGKAPVSRDLLDEATRVLEATRELVARGALSYGLVIASRLA